MINYTNRVVEKFHGAQFLQPGALQHFMGSIFVDACKYASIYTRKQACFVSLILRIFDYR